MFDETATVEMNERLQGAYRYLILDAPRLAAAAKPGQFVHLRVPTLEDSALRRPFSIFDADGASGVVTLLYKEVGRGTAALSRVLPGAKLQVAGPLGRGFPLEGSARPLLVGGGFGVAPLHFLAKSLLRRKPILFVGGRTSDDLLALDRFDAIGVETRLATNDGSAGVKGFVTLPLDEEIAALKAANADFELFTCGPDGLLKAVAIRAIECGVKGWISMDRHMVCGVGACFACIQKTVHGNARCCVDGPIFAAEELVF